MLDVAQKPKPKKPKKQTEKPQNFANLSKFAEWRPGSAEEDFLNFRRGFSLFRERGLFLTQRGEQPEAQLCAILSPLTHLS